MFLSIFDIFKIGIGPSSSHTMGPMSAANAFLTYLQNALASGQIPTQKIYMRVSLHGSLAFTGKGHATDRAVILGLLGMQPDQFDLSLADQKRSQLSITHIIDLPDLPQLHFNPDQDVIFDYEQALPGHSNGMKIWCQSETGHILLSETYYSIGGGFIQTEAELTQKDQLQQDPCPNCPYPFENAEKMLELGDISGKSIADMKWANELARRDETSLREGITRIWQVMSDCIDQGLATDGILPGGLDVKRRAADIHHQLQKSRHRNDINPHEINDWISVYAMAVNEQNAAGAQLVTAPTNGAAGVVPAVLRYYLDHCHGANDTKISEFLLTAAAIGGLIKYNASISGAEVGCQGEVGSASAMAAAGLCAVLGGSNAQIENAAEIALEHHLGMTCDPVKGLVQVPCIERNGLGAIKAVSAASLALKGDGQHFMPLDNCIEAMRQTGLEMGEKYKETSLGGLAVNLPSC